MYSYEKTNVKPPTPAETKLLICVWHPFTLWRPPAEFVARVRETYPAMRVVHLPTYDGLDREIEDADILVGFSLRLQQLARARRLKWIHATAAGVGQLMYPEFRASGIVLTNASGVHAIPMAEHIIGMLLAMARNFPAAMRAQAERRWAQQEIWDDPGARPRELASATLLLVGFGAIGREVARIARALGMRIHAVTRSGKGNTQLAEKIFPAENLLEALREADYVVVAAPETPATHRLISTRELKAMKPTAVLVNVARGTLVDEAALIEALKRGTIAGAALDVAEQEPLPPESPLWVLPNVLLTPHVSSVSEQLWQRQGDLMLENLARWFAGQPLRNVVDVQRGY